MFTRDQCRLVISISWDYGYYSIEPNKVPPIYGMRDMNIREYL